MAYSNQFVKILEWMLGQGFLSPGGTAEIDRILEGVDIEGKFVLDIGCGIGGIDRILISDYKAKKVIGIDVVENLIERAITDAEAAGLTEQIEYLLIEPGNLDFENETFDVVFTKDTIVHVKDKGAIFEDIFRILKPGGSLVGNDWLGSDTTNSSRLVQDWLDYSKLDFLFWTGTQTTEKLRQIGFQEIFLHDRNKWYQTAVREEIATVSGENRERFAAVFGEEQADARIKSSRYKMKVVDAGELRPTIFRAVKPKN